MKIRVKNATKQGYAEVRSGGVMSLSYPESKTRRGRVVDDGETSPTLDTGCEVGVVEIVDDTYANRDPRFYDETAPTLRSGRDGLKVMQVGQIYGTEREPNPQAGRIYSEEGISPTLDSCGGGNRMPKIVRACLTPEREKKRQQGRRFKEDGEEAFTVTAQDKHGVLLDDGTQVRIRKLTPKECFRLQGFPDEYFERAAEVNSDSQLYKQAGNSVTVNVVYEIAKRLKAIEEKEGRENMAELITVKQLPVLEEKFREKGAEIEEKVKACQSMVVTEDNYKDIKKVRAELNKEAKLYADEFRTVKIRVLTPWELVETAYNENVKKKYAIADQELKTKIGEVEQVLKDEKEAEITAYFEEYRQSLELDFVRWEDAQIRVGLSDSKKKLKEQAKEFLDHITDDLELISTQEHKAEILAEYKRTLNVSRAITTVSDRIAREEAERKAEAERQAKKEEEAKHDEEVRSHFTAPRQAKYPAEIVDEPYREHFISFKVYGSVEELTQLVSFMKENGYRYEQIKQEG